MVLNKKRKLKIRKTFKSIGRGFRKTGKGLRKFRKAVEKSRIPEFAFNFNRALEETIGGVPDLPQRRKIRKRRKGEFDDFGFDFGF